MEGLNKLKADIKELIALDMNKGLLKMKSHLKINSASYDQALSTLATYNQLNDAVHKGIISYQEAYIFFNRLIISAISAVNVIQPDELLEQ